MIILIMRCDSLIMRPYNEVFGTILEVTDAVKDPLHLVIQWSLLGFTMSSGV